MQYIKRIIFLLVAISFTSSMYSQDYFGDQTEMQKILKNIDQFSQYYMSGDAAKIAACYTSDGKIFPNDSDIIEGTSKLEKWWTVPKTIKILRHKITPVEIRILGDYAHDFGYYEGETLKADGSKSSWRGKYVIVWQKVEGEWKIYLDIWNRIKEPKKQD